jgi:Tol biopolymer transport system component
MSPDSNFFVISLKSGEGYDLFLRDIGTGETISRLTTTGETTGIHNLHPDFSPDGQLGSIRGAAGRQRQG